MVNHDPTNERQQQRLHQFQSEVDKRETVCKATPCTVVHASLNEHPATKRTIRTQSNPCPNTHQKGPKLLTILWQNSDRELDLAIAEPYHRPTLESRDEHSIFNIRGSRICVPVLTHRYKPTSRTGADSPVSSDARTSPLKIELEARGYVRRGFLTPFKKSGKQRHVPHLTLSFSPSFFPYLILRRLRSRCSSSPSS